jgi:hypothetical protein
MCGTFGQVSAHMIPTVRDTHALIIKWKSQDSFAFSIAEVPLHLSPHAAYPGALPALIINYLRGTPC